jgi:negative regulator of replication initiation
VIKIEVDEKVYQYLKQNSTFEDSPNSVLHRLLHLVEGNIAIPEKRTADIFPNFPLNTPKLLALPLCDRIQSNFDVRVHSLI